MPLPMHLASRCRARSKRSRLQCRAPAVRGSSVCRIHWAAGGAPRGNRNAWKHGAGAAETLALKREIHERLLADRQAALVERLSLGVTALTVVQRRQVDEAVCGVGVVGSERHLADCQAALVERLGLRVTAPGRSARLSRSPSRRCDGWRAAA